MSTLPAADLSPFASPHLPTSQHVPMQPQVLHQERRGLTTAQQAGTQNLAPTVWAEREHKPGHPPADFLNVLLLSTAQVTPARATTRLRTTSPDRKWGSGGT